MFETELIITEESNRVNWYSLILYMFWYAFKQKTTIYTLFTKDRTHERDFWPAFSCSLTGLSPDNRMNLCCFSRFTLELSSKLKQQCSFRSFVFAYSYILQGQSSPSIHRCGLLTRIPPMSIGISGTIHAQILVLEIKTAVLTFANFQYLKSVWLCISQRLLIHPVSVEAIQSITGWSNLLA